MTLGRMEPVSLRDPWPREDRDFTPWLAEDGNLSLLSDVLGLELELEAVERNVGPFRADILCKDTASDRWVLVENQLERTDHTHLGQLLTYAAGLDAVTIVWIAAKVAAEHRAALDWLNEITESEVRFFALEVELWRIGDSAPAPRFNIVCQPNDWARQTAAAKREVNGDISPLRQLQRDFWEGVEAKIAETGGPLRPVAPQYQSWITHGIGRTGVALGLSMNTRDNWVRVEIYLSGKWAAQDWAALESHRADIEEALGFALDWQELPDKADFRICHARLHSDPTDKAQWPELQSWLCSMALRFNSAFRPHVSRLPRAAGREISE